MNARHPTPTPPRQYSEAALEAELRQRVKDLPGEDLIDAETAIARARKRLRERFRPSPR